VGGSRTLWPGDMIKKVPVCWGGGGGLPIPRRGWGGGGSQQRNLSLKGLAEEGKEKLGQRKDEFFVFHVGRGRNKKKDGEGNAGFRQQR